ncbi:MAG: peptidoglycan editing factor PgeF [Marivirga sp.]|nr:peptidoglycan editing factor PgeF [Marivirga sp.]
MKKININGIDLWQFQELGNESSVRHFVTDRNTYPDGKEFTLSYSSTPDKEHVNRNRVLLAEAMQVKPSKLHFPSQVHKTRVLHVTHQTLKDELLETDALITSEQGICIAVMSADCVPVLLYDKRNNAIAAVHSGWRGTVAKILDKTLKEMHSLFGTNGEDLIAAIGPSVSQESYEVGNEVVEAVNNAFGKDNELLIPRPDQKAKLDLWKANTLQLLEFGVSPSRIEISNLCTVTNNQYFFSARKGDAGRFAAGIVLI